MPWWATEGGGSRESRSRRSEEHTSELQSLCNLVCRLLLEKKKRNYQPSHRHAAPHHHFVPPPGIAVVALSQVPRASRSFGTPTRPYTSHTPSPTTTEYSRC